MSALPTRVGRMDLFTGTEPYFYSEDAEYKVTSKAIETSVFAPEILGLAIAGILALFATVISLVLGYTVFSLIFAVPVIGVLLGYGFILYLKKYSKFH